MMIAAAHLHPGDLLATGQRLLRAEPRADAPGWTYLREETPYGGASTLPPYDGPLVCRNPVNSRAQVYPNAFLIDVAERLR